MSRCGICFYVYEEYFIVGWCVFVFGKLNCV